MDTATVDSYDPESPYGAKESGEGPIQPVIPAILNAIYDAIGVRFTTLPVTPEKVLAALKARGKIPKKSRSRVSGKAAIK
jgi:4-hydroxybenzoyl-CoA reductase subunit alpha